LSPKIRRAVPTPSRRIFCYEKNLRFFSSFASRTALFLQRRKTSGSEFQKFFVNYLDAASMLESQRAKVNVQWLMWYCVSIMVICKNTNQLDPQHGGYSDVRLWPCYIPISGAALLLIPAFGEFWALLVVGLPTLWIMGRVAKIQERDPESVRLAWKRIDDLYEELESKNAIVSTVPASPATKSRQTHTGVRSATMLPGAALSR